MKMQSGIRCQQVRRRRSRRQRPASRLAFESLESRLLLYAAVDDWAPAVAEGEETPLPDFTLIDANSTSSTYNQGVSPRDYLQEVSGWYFGTAT